MAAGPDFERANRFRKAEDLQLDCDSKNRNPKEDTADNEMDVERRVALSAAGREEETCHH
jgi:hypothetical protein